LSDNDSETPSSNSTESKSNIYSTCNSTPKNNHKREESKSEYNGKEGSRLSKKKPLNISSQESKISSKSPNDLTSDHIMKCNLTIESTPHISTPREDSQNSCPKSPASSIQKMVAKETPQSQHPPTIFSNKSKFHLPSDVKSPGTG
jgi:hypothetical protein